MNTYMGYPTCTKCGNTNTKDYMSADNEICKYCYAKLKGVIKEVSLQQMEDLRRRKITIEALRPYTAYTSIIYDDNYDLIGNVQKAHINMVSDESTTASLYVDTKNNGCHIMETAKVSYRILSIIQMVCICHAYKTLMRPDHSYIGRVALMSLSDEFNPCVTVLGQNGGKDVILPPSEIDSMSVIIDPRNSPVRSFIALRF